MKQETKNHEWTIIIDSMKSIRKDISDFKNEIKEEILKLETKIDLLSKQYNQNTIKIAELRTGYNERIKGCNERFKNIDDKIIAMNDKNKDFWARLTGVIAIILSVFNIIFIIVKLIK